MNKGSVWGGEARRHQEGCGEAGWGWGKQATGILELPPSKECLHTIPTNHWIGCSRESSGRVHPASWAKNQSADFWPLASPFCTSGSEMDVLVVERVACMC